MAFNVTEVDRLLTTTRSVRKKLDLERDVPTEVLLELYHDAGSSLLDAMSRTEAGGRTTTRRVFSSAGHLALNLERVPALVILGIWGIHDGSGKPSLFDSSIQAGWSFCLAARARGLGTAWTTLHLERREQAAALLGIPPGFTQIVLFPVAYTTQDDFRPVERRPAKEITYMDQWGFTDAGIPLDQRANPLEGRGVCVSIDIGASAERVWELATDITTPSRHCKEAAGAGWDDGAVPGVGATFKGRNATDDTGHPIIDAALLRLVGAMEWETPCTVTVWEPGRQFEYGVGEKDNPWASWGFRIEPLLGGGVRLEHYLVHGGAISGTALAALENPAGADDIVTGRFRMVRDNLTQVVEGVKKEAEAAVA